MFIDEKYTHEINSICSHLKNSVNPIQIVNWLYNFHESEWSLALTILSKVKYYNISDINNQLNISLEKSLNAIPSGSIIYIHAVGKYGKSGTAMMYFVQKTQSLLWHKQKKANIKIIEQASEFKIVESNSHLILIDDIIGSGTSTFEYYRDFILIHLTSPNIFITIQVACITYMKPAFKNLLSISKTVKIHGDVALPAFSSSGALFGSRKKMLEVRNFCYEYGIKIYKSFPLGYKNSQSLIAFAHATPNNTIPIIWSDKPLKSTGKQWIPLYPRSAEVRIAQAKALRDDSKLWAYHAYNIGLLKFNKLNNSFNTIDYRIMVIMRLKKVGILPPTICQQLGMNLSEYEEIIKSGIEKDIFNSTGELTPIAEAFYRYMKKNVKLSNVKSKEYRLPLYKMHVPEPSWKKD